MVRFGSIPTNNDFNEDVEDIIGTKVVAGTNTSVSYNDTTGDTMVSAAITVGASLPVSGSTGQLYYDTTTLRLNLWNGSEWVYFTATTPAGISRLLLETGDYILLEDGSKLILE